MIPGNYGAIMTTVQATLTVLVENTTELPNLEYEHGLAFWIETKNGRLLWDTGQSDMLIRNAEKLNIPLASTTHIALSHGHYDHTGGLPQAFELVPHARVFGHPDIFIQRYSQNFTRTNKVKPVGFPFERISIEQKCESLNLYTGMTEIMPGIFTTGEIPRINGYEDTGGNFFLDMECKKPDALLDDQALYFQSPKGIVVLLGCAHAGIVNTMNHISKLTGQKKMYAVLGGMHLLRASQKRLNATAETLACFDIQVIGPCHCTGRKAMSYLKSHFSDKFVNCSVGSRFTF